MKNFIFIGLYYYLCIFKWGFVLYLGNELFIYNVFLKFFGISFNDDIILKVCLDFGKCLDLKMFFEECNLILVKLVFFINISEFKLLLKSCFSGSYNCFKNIVKLDKGLKRWF